MFVLLFSIKKAPLAGMECREVVMWHHPIWKNTLERRYLQCAVPKLMPHYPFNLLFLQCFSYRGKTGKRYGHNDIYAHLNFLPTFQFKMSTPALQKGRYKCQGTWPLIKVEEMTGQPWKIYPRKNDLMLWRIKMISNFHTSYICLNYVEQQKTKPL